MNSAWFMGLFASTIISSLAAAIVAFLRTRTPQIETRLIEADDWLNGKLGIDLGGSTAQKEHDIIHGAVAAVNKYALDPKVWREVIRAIQSKDPAKAETLYNLVQSINWENTAASIEAAMPDEMKSIYNAVKEELATKTARANLITAAPESKMNSAAIRATIQAVAPAHKPVEGPMRPALVVQMIEDLRAKNALAK